MPVQYQQNPCYKRKTTNNQVRGGLQHATVAVQVRNDLVKCTVALYSRGRERYTDCTVSTLRFGSHGTGLVSSCPRYVTVFPYGL
jgi:hypothetical protein